jgi:L-cystine transport system substrate-binding protein
MKKRFLAIATTASLALGLAACGSSSASGDASAGTSAATEQTSDNASDSSDVRTITVAHTQSYVPYDFVDEDGNHDGYEVAVLKAVDELLPQYEFVYEGTTDDDLLIGVESGKYQIGTKGVWWTEARSETYVFPEHYIGASITGLVFRTENADEITDMASFADFSGSLVPLAPQNAQYTIIENFNKNNPDHQIDLIAADQFSNSDAYQWVIEGRYDATFEIKTNYENNIEKDTGEFHQYADQLSYVAYEAIPTWPLFNINEQQLADDYDAAWEQLEEDGTLAELQEEYFGYSLFDLIPEGYEKGDEL